MVMSFDVNTDMLLPEESEELNQLVDSADFFELPAEILSQESGVDQFQYRLTVETEEKQHTVEVGDTAVPENLWPIIDKLRTLSRSNRNL